MSSTARDDEGIELGELPPTGDQTRWARIKKRFAAPPPPKSLDDAPEIPVARASYFSKLTFHWVQPLLRTGFRRPLESSDLWRMDASRQSEGLSDRLLVNIDKRQKEREAYNVRLATAEPSWFRQALLAVHVLTHSHLKKDLSEFGGDETAAERFKTMRAEWRQRSGKRSGGTMLALALLDTFPDLLWCIPYKMVVDAVGIVTPLLTKAIIRFSQEAYAAKHGASIKPPELGRGVAMALGFFLLYAFQWFMQGQFQFGAFQTGLMAKAALSQAVFRTAFAHSVPARAEHPTGKLITHLSADAMRVQMAPRLLVIMLVSPLTLIAALVLLCVQIGVAGIVGFVVIVLASPVQGWVTRRVFQQRKKSTTFTQQRTQLLQELLASMSTVKMFTYELPFLSRLAGIRGSEMHGVRNIQFLRAASQSIMDCLPMLGSIFAFIMYSALHPKMDIANLFTAVIYFSILQAPLGQIPTALAALADAVNALQRVATVFDAEQRVEAEGSAIDPHLDVAVRVENASFQWEAPPSKESPDGNSNSGNGNGNNAEPFAIRDLNLQIPRGQLAAIIGPVGSGKSSILQGLLGEMRSLSPFQVVKFGGQTAYCQQSPWIQNATVRDNILFGRPWDEERYWACIRQANLTRDLEILADGDLTEIGEKGINLSGGQKQRINIARALYFDADVFLLDDPLSALDAHVGKAVFNDAILGLRDAGKTVLLVTHGVHFLPYVDYIYSVDGGRVVEQGTYPELLLSPSFKFFIDTYGGGAAEDTEQDDKSASVSTEASTAKAAGSGDEKGRLTVAEKRITGAVGPYVYLAYVVAGNVLWLGPILLMVVCMEASQLMSRVWLIYWEANRFHRLPPFYQGIYALLGLISAVFTIFAGATFALLAVTASKNLFSKALRHVFFSPMSFFDTTPLGRIQGIFSTDITAVDNQVPEALHAVLLIIAGLVGSIIIISIQFPYYAAIVAIVALLYSAIVFYYRRFAREVKRLDSIHRSMLFSHFSESLTGLPTIRAYGQSANFIGTNARLVDLQNRATILNGAGMMWLLIRLELVGSILVLAVGLMCTVGGSSIAPGEVALVLTYVIQTTSMLGALSAASTYLETAMNSVERILFYTDGRLPQEAAYEIKATDPGDKWPSGGAVKLDKVVMSYRPGQPIVLKGVSIDIKPGERVGIVGRTGAGKSSITVALYRLAEVLSGTITIDGVDISKIGLKTLRSNLAIIPQDPVLFSGTLRTNLDPFDEFPDAVLHDALCRARLEKGPPGAYDTRFTLDMPIDTGGANLSIGERSLVSLARAIVRNSKIMVLDEATASVDLETDAQIQSAIRQECQRSRKTLLCIAHRLRTIIGWDKILVMEAGEVVDFASPLELFDAGGVFRGMCDESRIAREEIERAQSSEAL